jgi:hypothetical protein
MPSIDSGGSELLLGFNTWGTPRLGFNHLAHPIQTTESCLSTLSPELGTRTQGHARPLRLGMRSIMGGGPQKVGHINIIVFTSYQGHPYPQTNNAINQVISAYPS